jgi:hypothetical protein
VQASESIDRDIADEWLQNSEILEQKRQDYSQRLEILQEAIPDDVQSLRFTQLELLNNQVKELIAEMQSKESELAGFNQLPPNLQLASEQLEEKKSQAVFYLLSYIAIYNSLDGTSGHETRAAFTYCPGTELAFYFKLECNIEMPIQVFLNIIRR